MQRWGEVGGVEELDYGGPDFAAEVGEPAAERRLPYPGPIDPAALGHAMVRHHYELLGQPPSTIG